MSYTNIQLRDKLLKHNIISNNDQDSSPETPPLNTPWFVKVLLAFTGWLAAIFLLGFIGLIFIEAFQAPAAGFIIGTAMITGSYFALRNPTNEFSEHLFLAISLAGQFLFVFATIQSANNSSAAQWGLIALMQTILAIVMPNYIHRLLSSFSAAVALELFCQYLAMPYIFSSLLMFLVAWLWLNEFKYFHMIKVFNPIAFGLTLALIVIESTTLFGENYIYQLTNIDPENINLKFWMGELTACVAIFYLVSRLLTKHSPSQTSSVGLAYLGALFLCGTSYEVQGFTAGILIILLGFSSGNRVLLGLGLASLLSFISAYYYLLEQTLLYKSTLLLAVGVTLIAAYSLLTLAAKKETGSHHA